MEKLLIEACLEMMAVPGLVVGIQDMGAAGLTCSTCETASRGGSGIEIEDVAQTLEAEGVASFAKSFDELVQSLTDKANQLSGEHGG